MLLRAGSGLVPTDASCSARTPSRYRGRVTPPLRLVQFPADDPARARGFWAGSWEWSLRTRARVRGQGWQTRGDGPALGLHPRGSGPGDQMSLPYFSVPDMDTALMRVGELGGVVIHPGERWSVCRDRWKPLRARSRPDVTGSSPAAPPKVSCGLTRSWRHEHDPEPP